MEKVYNSLIKTGLSNQPKEVPFFTDEPNFINYFTIPNKNAEKKYDIKNVYGQGFDSNRDISKIKSVGEMLERLCLCNPKQKFNITKFKEKKDFIRPSLFFCYSSEQMENIREKKEKLDNGKYRWMKVKKIPEGKEVYMPAQMVFLTRNFKGEYALRKEQISTGAAMGIKGEKRAFKSGFLESIERDAIMSFYLKKRRGRKMYDFSDKISELRDYLKRYQLETHIFDATTDLGIPSIFAMTIDYSGLGEAVNVGSSSDLNYEKAIEKAITESIQCRRIGRVSTSFLKADSINKSQINSLEDRLLYWRDLNRIKDVSHLIKERENISYKKISPKDITLNNAIENLSSKKFNILVADMTLPEVKAQGFESLKVVIPELHPLYLDEKAKALYSIHHGEIKENPNLKPHPVT